LLARLAKHRIELTPVSGVSAPEIASPMATMRASEAPSAEAASTIERSNQASDET